MDEALEASINIINSDFPNINLAIYTVINRQYPTLRDCNKTTVFAFSGTDIQTNIRIAYGISTLSEAGFLFSANGTIDSTNLLISLFDQLPNFLISFEETENEN